MGDDPFAALGMPRSYDLDPAAVQAAYLKRSAALHPDRFTDPLQQVQAARDAAVINDARATLMNDEARAEALLRLLGGPAREQDKSLPGNLLVHMMEVRQQMEEALASGEPAERLRLEHWARARRQEHVESVRELFRRALQGTAPGDALRDIRLQLNAWRYIERMIEQLDPDYS